MESRRLMILLSVLLIIALAEKSGANDVTFSARRVVADSFTEAHAVHGADIDGDGDVDILGAAHGARLITWWENSAGDATAWTEHIVDNDFGNASDVYAADVDGDGDMDILGSAFGDEVAWWENMTGDATVLTKHTLSTEFDGPAAIHAADVDGDGDLDILVPGKRANAIVWWENTVGDASAWTMHTVVEGFIGASDVYTADLDGDGDLDILGSADLDDEVAWWENTTGDAMTWTKHSVERFLTFVEAVHAADVDGDGDLDVLSAIEGRDDIAWWENTVGNGTTWVKHIVDDFFDVASSVNTADVDADGDLDILGSATVDHDITWWENTAGDATTWAEHTVDSNFRGAHDVEAVDVDGDGDLDLIGAAFGDGEIAWWENETIHHNPMVNHSGVVNGASFRPATEPDGAVAPGSIISVFGSNLAAETLLASVIPLPTVLGETSATFNGTAAPLFVATSGQINAQLPFDLLPGVVQAQVTRGGETSEAQSVTVAPVSPGIFTTNQQGTGQGAILISNTPILAAPTDSIPGRETRPANRLEFISIFCTGLGDVTNRPASGEPPSGGLSTTVQTPTVTIGGVEVPVSFSGLTGFVGLYQVDVQIPTNAPTGDAVELVITIGGVPSNSVTIAIQ